MSKSKAVEKEVETVVDSSVAPVVAKKKLELIPNEIIGYRIRPDQWNWTVVVVKVHGKDSKNAGQQYESTPPLAYCKSLEHAVQFIFNRVAAIEGRKSQDEHMEKTGMSTDLEALKTAFNKAQEVALWAVKDLESRLGEAGINVKNLHRVMMNSSTEEAAEESDE